MLMSGSIARLMETKRQGRCTVIFDAECDASWNVQQHSLQRRLAPTNTAEAKAAFFEGGCRADPVFEYEHEIEPHQLERFPVCKRFLRYSSSALRFLCRALQIGCQRRTGGAISTEPGRRRACAGRRSNCWTR